MLTITNLCKTYANGVRALDDVSITVPVGVFGLLGPNGAGKSTLMRTIATLQPPDSGDIHLDEMDVLRTPLEARRVLGFLPQDFGVYPKCSAMELLHYFARLRGYHQRVERTEMIEHLLMLTNLWDVRKRELDGFSGGMRQRFGVAQALIGNPRLVMVDEPTAGLDPQERLRLLDLLCEVGTSAAVLLSTHIVEDVSDICARMAIIDKGRVLMQGNPSEAVSTVTDRIWSSSVARSELADYECQYRIICRRLSAGRHTVYVYSDTRPGEHFAQVAPLLEHVYFQRLSACNSAPSTFQAARDKSAPVPVASDGGSLQ